MDRTSSTDSWGQILTPECRNTDLLDLRGRRRAGARPEPSSWGSGSVLSRSTMGSGWTAAGRWWSWVAPSEQEVDQGSDRKYRQIREIRVHQGEPVAMEVGGV